MYRAQHMQAGAIGNDIDVHILAFCAIIFEDVSGVIQREVHDRGIILIDLNGNAVRFRDTMRFRVACKTRRDKRHRYKSHEHQMTKKLSHHNIPIDLV